MRFSHRGQETFQPSWRLAGSHRSLSPVCLLVATSLSVYLSIAILSRCHTLFYAPSRSAVARPSPCRQSVPRWSSVRCPPVSLHRCRGRRRLVCRRCRCRAIALSSCSRDLSIDSNCATLTRSSSVCVATDVAATVTASSVLVCESAAAAAAEADAAEAFKNLPRHQA
eukprot:COSAG06_NODE_151_length_21964_cov_95.963961_21_plen_168_part_00